MIRTRDEENAILKKAEAKIRRYAADILQAVRAQAPEVVEERRAGVGLNLTLRFGQVGVVVVLMPKYDGADSYYRRPTETVTVRIERSYREGPAKRFQERKTGFPLDEVVEYIMKRKQKLEIENLREATLATRTFDLLKKVKAFQEPLGVKYQNNEPSWENHLYIKVDDRAGVKLVLPVLTLEQVKHLFTEAKKLGL